MPDIRRQATLFLRNVPTIEASRQTFNPKQAGLISAHVTLCREDEVRDWDRVAARLKSRPPVVTLEFGLPNRDRDLVFIPGNDKSGSFRFLREYLLETKQVRDHKPHITLIHPRNGECSDTAWETLRTKIKPFEYTFNEVSFILQKDGGAWQILQTFSLK